MAFAARQLDRRSMPRKSTYRAPADVRQLGPDEAFGELAPDSLLMAPSVLFAAGDISLLKSPRRVSVVGARSATEAALRRSTKLARQLAEAGVVVVSGLAKGIDKAAHDAAIAAGGKTIAVIGTPIVKAYPAEHADLQELIYREHLLVSQFPVGQQVYPSNFIARNRTMAMLSHASVVVEASETSGSLSQAAEIQRLGRPLFIMRSVVETTDLKWPQKFLKAGAIVLDDTAQILESLTR